MRHEARPRAQIRARRDLPTQPRAAEAPAHSATTRRFTPSRKEGSPGTARDTRNAKSPLTMSDMAQTLSLTNSRATILFCRCHRGCPGGVRVPPPRACVCHGRCVGQLLGPVHGAAAQLGVQCVCTARGGRSGRLARVDGARTSSVGGHDAARPTGRHSSPPHPRCAPRYADGHPPPSFSHEEDRAFRVLSRC